MGSVVRIGIVGIIAALIMSAIGISFGIQLAACAVLGLWLGLTGYPVKN